MRSLKGANTAVKNQAYKTIVRPILDYGGTVWDVHSKQEVELVEKVQRVAARRVTNKVRKWESRRNEQGRVVKERVSVKKLLIDLDWESMEERRKTSRLCNMWRIWNGIGGWKVFQEKLERKARDGRDSHRWVLKSCSFKTDLLKQGFLNQTIQDWNKLPASIMTIENIAESEVKRFRQLLNLFI